MRALCVLGLLLMLSAVAAGVCACGGQEADAAPRVEPDSPCADAMESFFLSRVRPGAISIDVMTPTLLSPRAEALADHCPPDLQIVHGDQQCEELTRDYLCALGAFDFGRRADAGGLSNDVSKRLAALWREVRATQSGDPATAGPLRVLITHYPRPEAPGRCVTLRATFYTIPDPHFELALGGNADREARLSGVLLRISKTWQLEGGQPRLVEAWMEAAARLGQSGGPPPLAQMLEAEGIAADAERDAHFADIGGGRRWGLGWFDRGYGTAAPRVWSGTWQTEGGSTRTGDLPATWRDALLTLIERL